MKGVMGWVNSLHHLALGLGTLVAGGTLIAVAVLALARHLPQTATVCAFGAYAAVKEAHFHLTKWMKG